SKAIPESDVVFIAVGTPPKNGGEADLSAVFKVAEKLGKHIKPGFTLVSCKSTVPVGTNIKVETILKKVKSKKAEVAVASCPEFLREGSAIYDTLNPDRVVIGSDSKKAIDKLLELHHPISGKRVITDLASAELIKYTSNAMLATKISFANLISFYCEKTGADVENVLDAVGIDKRIGRIFMDPGVGYGGSCLPKDVNALIKIGESLDIDTSYLKGVVNVNSLSRSNFTNKILNVVKDKKIAIWGLSFKPNTDDIREAPSFYLINELLEKGYSIRVYDPAAMENFKKIYGKKIQFGKDPYGVLKNASALIILTEWNEFKQVDLKKIKKLLKKPVIFDGRNIFEPKVMENFGFSYFSVGRKAISPPRHSEGV
ncbi:hypothetical protein A2767_06560, partial [Candidatus Roizmanbacteria bacterium RIFCSPHIGHO2_01_FULL_35_10]